MISQEQRDGILANIGKGLNSRGKLSKDKKNKQVRKAFSDFIV